MWKKEHIRTILLLIAVAIVALVVNATRTPILQAAAQQGRISKVKAWDLSGIRLVDNWRPRTIGSQYGSDPSRSPAMTAQRIDIMTAKKFFDDGQCIFIDARPPASFEQGHIKGSLNWNCDDFDTCLKKFGMTIPKNACVVAYCNGGPCDASPHLAMALLAEGWQDVYLFEGGLEEWKAYQLPLETGTGSQK
jgi:rhodanese-related sulfurtransferase